MDWADSLYSTATQAANTYANKWVESQFSTPAATATAAPAATAAPWYQTTAGKIALGVGALVLGVILVKKLAK